MERRLSSDYLYHYKHSYDTIEKTIMYGFRHNLWDEELPFTNYKQYNFMVCFCDIRWGDNDYHMSCYGKNALVMKKDWAIKNGVTPVSYVHNSSPIMDDSWTVRRYLNQIARNFLAKHFGGVQPSNYVAIIEENENQIKTYGMNKSNLETITNNPNWQQQFFTKISSIATTACSYPPQLADAFDALFLELEKRDALSRIYQGDFTHPVSGFFPNKIFYDEREWRSLKMPNINDAQQSFINQFLPPSYNLIFDDDDVEYIILENHRHKQDLINLIQSPKTLTLLTSKSIPKIKLLCQMKKEIAKRKAKGDIF